jgi:hypothetical protein
MTWLLKLPIMIHKFMMKQWTMKFYDENMMVGSWVVLSLASGGVSGEQLYGKDVFFSSLAGTFAFIILDQKLCFDCFCMSDTPSGGLIARK